MILKINIDEPVDKFSYDQYINEKSNITFLTRLDIMEHSIDNYSGKIYNGSNMNNENNTTNINNMYGANSNSVSMNRTTNTYSLCKTHAKKITKYMYDRVKNNG